MMTARSAVPRSCKMDRASLLSQHSGPSQAVVRMLAYTTLLFVCCTLPALVLADRSYVTFMRDENKIRDRRLHFEEAPGNCPPSFPGGSPEVWTQMHENEADSGEALDWKFFKAPPASTVNLDSQPPAWNAAHGGDLHGTVDIAGGLHMHHGVEAARQLLSTVNILKDISPPGMWPPQDDTPPPSRRFLITDETVNSPDIHANFRRYTESDRNTPGDHRLQPSRRMLLSYLGDISPPGMWSGDDDDNDESYRGPDRGHQRTLLSDLRDISPPGMWSGDDDDDGESYRGHQRTLLSDLRDISPPGMWSGDDDDDGESYRGHQRTLLSDLRDISPPGMWSGDDDDDDEYFHETGRQLLAHLDDDLSPGIWTGDDEYLSEQRRNLLANLRDMSPPGMWSGEDGDDEHSQEHGRVLLADLRDISPPGGWYDDDGDDDELFYEHGRNLLTILPDISPPGIWPDDDDDDEDFYEHRRNLLAYRREISRPTLWSDNDGSDEKLRGQRRSPPSDVRDNSPLGEWLDDADNADNQQVYDHQGRSLLADLGDVSPPGIGSDDDDDEIFHDQKRRVLHDLRDKSSSGVWFENGNDDSQILSEQIERRCRFSSDKYLRSSAPLRNVDNSVSPKVKFGEDCDNVAERPVGSRDPSTAEGTQHEGIRNHIDDGRRDEGMFLIRTRGPFSMSFVLDIKNVGQAADAHHDVNYQPEVAQLPPSYLGVVRLLSRDLMNKLLQYILPCGGMSKRRNDGGHGLVDLTKSAIRTPIISDLSEIVSEDVTVSDLSAVVSEEVTISNLSEIVSEEVPISNLCKIVSEDVTIPNLSETVSEEVTISDVSKMVSEDVRHPWKSLITSILSHIPIQLPLKIEHAAVPAHSGRLTFPELSVHYGDGVLLPGAPQGNYRS